MKHVRLRPHRSVQVVAALDLCALIAVAVLVVTNVVGSNQAHGAQPPTQPAPVETSPSPSASPSTSASAAVRDRGGRFGHGAGRFVSADVDGDGAVDRVTISKVSDYQWRLTAKLASTTCSGTLPGLPTTDPVLYGAYQPQGLNRDLVVASANDIDDHVTVDMWELGPKCRWTMIQSPVDIGFGRGLESAWTARCTDDGLAVSTSEWTDQAFTRARTTTQYFTLEGTGWKRASAVHSITTGAGTNTLGALRCGGFAWHA